jgi:hypothetical protein
MQFQAHAISTGHNPGLQLQGLQGWAIADEEAVEVSAPTGLTCCRDVGTGIDYYRRTTIDRVQQCVRAGGVAHMYVDGTMRWPDTPWFRAPR